jgi:hypothetical protein
MKNGFKHFSDAGHGWVAVPMALILELGIQAQISNYSFVNKTTVYLEEDGDTLAFMNAYRAKFGAQPVIDFRPSSKGTSTIRRYARYSSQGAA